jgi:predicted small metal-binding protein
MKYMKTLACRDAGFDCGHVVEGGTDDEVLERGKEHLIKEHGMKEEHITPEMKEKARRAIHTS